MCNLFANTIPQSAMRALFAVAEDHLGNDPARPAIFPKMQAPIVGIGPDGQRWLRLAEWGFVLPQLSKRTGRPIQPKAVNNARDDRLRSTPFWAKSFALRRCLIPASSYCETKGRAPATHVWFGLAGDGPRPPFACAGLWCMAAPRAASDPPRLTVAMVTTTPNALTRTVHPDRMPAILDPAQYDTWLQGSEAAAQALLAPYPAERMVVHQAGIGLLADPGGRS